MKISLSNLIGEQELAERLHVSRKTLKNKVALGLLPLPLALPTSQRLFFVREEIDAWVARTAKRRAPAGEDPRGRRKGRKTIATQRAERGE